MKAQLQYSWIKDSDFNSKNPIDCEVQDCVLGGKNNAEKILQFRTSEGMRQMSMYGDNWNLLVKSFGEETDDWKKHRFRLLQFTNATDGKKQRRIEI